MVRWSRQRWSRQWRLAAVSGLSAALLLPGAALAAPRPVPVPGPAPAGRPAGAADVVLYDFNTGLLLTVSTRARPGSAVQIKRDTGLGQQWLVSGRGTIRPVDQPGLCLTVPGASYRPGTALDVAACDGGQAQRFTRHAPSGRTPVFFISPAASPGRCVAGLDAAGVPAPGDRAGLQRCAGLASQAWTFSDLRGRAGPIGGLRTLQAARVAAGAAVTAARRFTGALNQYWLVSRVGSTRPRLLRLRPVSNAGLCLARQAGPAGGPVRLARCDGSARQDLMAIPLGSGTGTVYYFLVSPDGRTCLQAAPGTGPASDVDTGRCEASRAAWPTPLSLPTSRYGQYAELYADTAGGPLYSMTVPGRPRSGDPVTVRADDRSPGQVWTDLTAGPGRPAGNPDGTISLRPLADQGLCLSVPGADYAAGVQLTVAACDGSPGQEFWRAMNGSSGRELISAGDGELCAGSAGPDEPVALQPCDQGRDQSWRQVSGWAGWAGRARSVFSGGRGGPALTLLPAGQVGVARASTGDPAHYWSALPGDGTLALRSVLDPALCLTAPSATAGTALDAVACDGGSGQEFRAVPQDITGLTEYELGGTGQCLAADDSPGPVDLQACVTSQPDEQWSGPP